MDGLRMDNLRMIVNATRALGMPWMAQVALFPDFVVVADELALNFDDAYRSVARLVEADLISAKQAAALAMIDEILRAMTDAADPDLWSEASLAARPEWQEVRVAACAALEVLNATGEATLGSIEYVRG